MDFKTAEGFMDEGRKLARDCWKPGQFAYRTPVAIKGDEIEFRMTSPGDENSTWEPSSEDIAATDWVLLDDEVMSGIQNEGTDTPPDPADPGLQITPDPED